MDLVELVGRSLGRRAIQAANKARDAGNPAEAAALYARALAVGDKRPQVYVQMGNMLKDSDQPQAAIDAYEMAHNLYQRRLKSRGMASDIRPRIADIYAQFGHLYKKFGYRDHAARFYRASHAIRPIDHLEEEIQIALITPHGVSDRMIDLRIPNLEGFDLATSGGGANQLNHLMAINECLCWSKRLRQIPAADENDLNLQCDVCGSEFSDEVAKLNMSTENFPVIPLSIDEDDLDRVLSSWGMDTRNKKIGLLGATIEGGPLETVDEILLTNKSISKGVFRCTYDLIVVWNLCRGISDMRCVVDQVFQAVKPNGHVVFGYSPPSVRAVLQNAKARALSLSAHGSRGKAQTHSTNRETLYALAPKALRSLIDPIARDATVATQEYEHHNGHKFVCVQKTGEMTFGIMSGIGDAVWSFVIARAVQRKYGASRITYHVHDSGDGRRKRSNNMLARFQFVDDLVSDVFQVHAETPMNNETGHLNYIDAGPSLINSKDKFDYRLIINTYLEHGQGYDEICRDLELDEKELDFDFFRDYEEYPKDIISTEKVRSFVGDDYAIFYYGAEIDNTSTGLNRDNIWSADDWNRLGRLINEKYGMKIVVIGAPYDLGYANQVLGKNADNFYLNTIGQLDITETLSLIQRAKFVVAFPAGVGIVGPYMRVPTAIFWRPKHLSYHVMHDRAGFDPEFAVNWVPPQVMQAGQYYPAWYGKDTPESIMDVIVNNKWAERTCKAPIGNW